MNVDALSNEVQTLGITRSCLPFEPSAERVWLGERFRQHNAIRDYSNVQKLFSIVSEEGEVFPLPWEDNWEDELLNIPFLMGLSTDQIETASIFS